MTISYQMPMPIGAPSSELTGVLRRYSWSSRKSSVWHLPRKVHQRRLEAELEISRCRPGWSITATTLPNSIYTLHCRSSTMV
jgi:hypothetical protein